MLVFGQIVLTVFLSLVVGFFLYWRFRERVTGMLSEQRDRLLHTEASFAKRLEDMPFHFVKDTKPVARELAEKLEAHFPLSYQVNVYNRMVKETKFPERKIMELLFEQKRFLLMASVLNSVAMFSKDVDEVWHQMLMFTREYERFCHGFAGQHIHHAPNVDGEDAPDSKFLFDMMYLLFFDSKSFSEDAWSSKFYAQKPSESLRNDIERLSPHVLESRYFFHTQHAQTVSSKTIFHIQASMQRMKDPANQLEFVNARKHTLQETRKRGKSTFTDDTPYLLSYLFWVSADTTVPYSEAMGHTVGTTNPDSGTAGGGSGGSGGWFGGGSNSCDSGSSGGGSSCGSSCGGGGCGSS